MNIWDLSTEVLENIFHYLDGHSLGRAEQVCNIWHAIIQNIQRVSNIWKICCLREIAKEVLEELLGNRAFPANADSCSQGIVDWKKVYKQWFCSRMISKWPHWTKWFQSFDANPITCVKVSGAYVVTGHRNGSVCAWNSLTGQLASVVSQHLKMVTDIALIDLLHLGPYGSDRLPWEHHHVISVSRDFTIQVCPLINEDCDEDDDDDYVYGQKIVICHHSDVLESIKVFGDHFAVNSLDNTIIIWHMTTPQHPSQALQITLKFTLIGPQDILRWMGFWYDKILCLCHVGSIQTFSLKDEEWSTSVFPRFHSRYKTMRSLESDVSGNDLTVSSAFVFREKTIFLLMYDRKFYASIDSEHFRQYQPMRKLHSHVVSVALWGTILALGLEGGTLHLYHLSDTDDLIHLHLGSPSWSQTLSEASIISIDIANPDGNAPIVVATTTETIYVIRWLPQKTRRVEMESAGCSFLFNNKE